jgi:hypothetical protein
MSLMPNTCDFYHIENKSQFPTVDTGIKMVGLQAISSIAPTTLFLVSSAGTLLIPSFTPSPGFLKILFPLPGCSHSSFHLIFFIQPHSCLCSGSFSSKIHDHLTCNELCLPQLSLSH